MAMQHNITTGVVATTPTEAVPATTRSLRKRLLREGIVVVMAKAASVVVMLAVTGLIARILPIEAVGSYFLAYSAVAILGVGLSFGMGDLALRLVARATLLEGTGHVGRVVRRVLGSVSVTLLAAVAAGLAGLVVLDGLHLLPAGLSLLAAALVVLWGATLAYRLVLSGILRGIGKVVFSNVCAHLAAGLLTLVLLSAWCLAGLPGHVAYVIAISLAAAVASVGLALALVRHFLAEPIGPRGLEQPGDLLRDGLPIAAVKLLSSTLLQAPLWVVAVLGGAAEAALFGASVRVAQSLGAAQLVSNQVGAPHVVTLEARGETARLARMSQALSFISILPPLVVLLALLLLGREFMTLVFGRAFAASAGPLIILIAGRVGQMACGSGRTLLLMTGHQRPLFLIDAVTVVVAVLGAAAGYRLCGINGAAAGTSVALIGGAFATAARVKRQLGFWPLHWAGLRPLLSSLYCPSRRAFWSLSRQPSEAVPSRGPTRS